MIPLYFAEFECDKLIRERYFPLRDYGMMVEVGGGKPDYLSMSRHWKMNGWKILVIEPNPSFAKMHREAGNDVEECACSDKDIDSTEFHIMHQPSGVITDESYSALEIRYPQSTGERQTVKVRVRRLDEILKDRGIDSIDLLTVDAEGWELEVLRGLSLQPRIVVVEDYLSWLGLPVNESHEEYMNSRGYKVDMTCKYNRIFTLKAKESPAFRQE